MGKFTVAVGLLGVQNLFDQRADAIIEVARMADNAGIDQVIVTDHVIMGENTDKYPYGDFPLPPEYPWFEPLTLLAAIAGATSSIRLATGILISPLRSAALLAKTTATLDALSNGRLDLGVGTGWQREEYEASAIPFNGRLGRLEDQLHALQVLWRDAPATFNSATVNFERMYSTPFPSQPGGVPLWLGMAPTPRVAQLMAECAVGWVPMPVPPEQLKTAAEPLREAFEAAGRDPDSLRIRAQPEIVRDAQGRGDLDRTLDTLDTTLDAGVTDLQFMITTFVQEPDQLPDFFRKIAQRRG
jgi:probable F420-dependent oxidoreductase